MASAPCNLHPSVLLECLPLQLPHLMPCVTSPLSSGSVLSRQRLCAQYRDWGDTIPSCQAHGSTAVQPLRCFRFTSCRTWVFVFGNPSSFSIGSFHDSKHQLETKHCCRCHHQRRFDSPLANFGQTFTCCIYQFLISTGFENPTVLLTCGTHD